MVAKASAGISNEKLESEEYANNYGEKYGASETESLITNSGSTNTGKNTTTNSGSVNTNNTKTDASKNVVENSGTFSMTSNSGRVDTSQLMLSESAVNHLTKQMLESTSGLAAVSSGQKVSGGYNSTANTLLTNDLLSRVAGDVAARSAKTVTTVGASSSSTVNSGSTQTQNIGATNSNTTQNIGASSSVTDALNIIGGSTTSNKGTTEMAEAALGVSEILKNQESTKTEAKVEAGWIVCTELVAQGRMPKRYYVPGLRTFNSYPPVIKRGYHLWAVYALAHLKNKPNSRISKVLEILMNARAEYLAAEFGVKDAKKTVLGWFTKQLVHVCWALGHLVTKPKGE